jgi:hypothetical protein
VGYEYIYLVNVFMFVCFFVSLQPIVSAFALVGYLLMYWVEKYCMFYRYKRPAPGTDFVNKVIYQFIFLGPLIYSLGSLTWSNFDPAGIPKEALLPNIIAAVFAGLLLVLPITPIILSCCIDANAVVKLTNYEDDRLFFPSEYDRVNPSTSLEGISDYKAFMQRKESEISKKSKKEQEEIMRKKRNGWQRGALNQAITHNVFAANPQIQNQAALNLGYLFASNQNNLMPSPPPPPPNRNNPPMGGINNMGAVHPEMGMNPMAYDMNPMGYGMNPMGYGMNPMGMNQMGMNPMGMNQIGGMMSPYSPSPYGYGQGGYGGW